MKNKPYIGISMRLSRHRIFKNSFIHGTPQDYVNAVLAAGAMPILLPVQEEGEILSEMLLMVDGIIISGSDSYISPKLWGGEEGNRVLELCPQSRIETEFDLALIHYSLSHGLPLLGICQGHELINIALGGSLQGNAVVGNHTPVLKKEFALMDKAPHDARLHAITRSQLKEEDCLNLGQWPAHKIKVTAESQLAHILLQGCPIGQTLNNTLKEDFALEVREGENYTKELLFDVNSFHGLSIRDLASPLEATAYAEDGTIEAIEWKRELHDCYPFLLGVQWHPEMLACNPESGLQAPSIKNKHIPMQGIFSHLVAEANLFRNRKKRHKVVFGDGNGEIRFLPRQRAIGETVRAELS